MERLFYTINEAAHARGVSHNVIREKCQSGEIVALFEGNQWKINRRLFDAAFDAECMADTESRLGE